LDRQIIYPGQIPLETDQLFQNRATMVALGKMIGAILGTGNVVTGLSVGPNTPAALNVVVAPGEMYSLQNVDGTAYSSLPADTTHTCVKQGLSSDPVIVACPAPVTAGFSINYLIEVTFQEVDGSSVVLPYYNASNPTQAFSGPNNSGAAQSTLRQGKAVVQAKAGIAAATGTQVTPAVDAGFVAIAVVTVANGQTTITAGNIAAVTSNSVLTQSMLSLIQSNPAQFDNSSKLATTAFVKASGFQFSSTTQYLAGAGPLALTASQAGSFIDLGSTYTGDIALPALSSVPDGATFYIWSGAGATFNVNRVGSDVIFNGITVASSITMSQGDTLVIGKSGPANGWVAMWGSAQFLFSAVGQSLAPKPSATATIGKFQSLIGTIGNAATLPAGGTWAYQALPFNNSGQVSQASPAPVAGVAAGGAAVGAATAGFFWYGFAWRIQ